MMAGSHVALGAAAWMAAAPYFGQPALEPLALGLAVLGGLLPDVDHPKSWVGKRLRPVSDVVAGVFGHRGITHSLLAVVACWWVLRHQAVPAAVAAPVVVGYLSHLFGDLLTPGGLRLSWPFKGTWALPICRTGSAFEPLVVALLVAAAWASVADRPQPRAMLEHIGLCLNCEALPLPPARPPSPPRRKLADQSPRGARG
ncbi:MAG: metal-dependent hydrolase [Belnapia sp.]|nr:metal-dependent hydrolase [Belnapia sp.]